MALEKLEFRFVRFGDRRTRFFYLTVTNDLVWLPWDSFDDRGTRFLPKR